jgi:hypothetical protein
MTKFIKGRFLKGHKPHNVGVRDEAKLRGDLRYFTGNPCKKGHISERSVSNGLCLECLKERMAARRKVRNEEQLNLDHEKARIRAAKWRKANPNHEGTKIAKKEYKIRNPHKVIAGTAKYRAQKISRTPSWLTKDDLWMIEQAYEIAALRTKMFGFSWHVDHVIPLNGDVVSGLHVPTNLQVIPWIENVKKHNKFDGV